MVVVFRESYDNWARREIARLRAEADTLEVALKRYLASTTTSESENASAATPPLVMGTPPPSKIGVAVDAIKANPKGLTVEEIVRAVAARGRVIKRHVLRSQLWQRVKDGKLVKRGNRYLMPETKEPGAVPGPST